MVDKIKNGIVTKPLDISPKITEKDLKKTAIGQKALELVKEAIQTGYLHQKHMHKYLKKMSKGNKVGTCFGQASAVIMADQGAKAGKEKKILSRVNAIDVLALQLLVDLDSTIKSSLLDTKDLIKETDKIDAKIKKIEEKELNKSQKKKLKKLKEEKERNDSILKDPKSHNKILSKDKETPGVQIIAPGKRKDFEKFQIKVKDLTRTLVAQHGGLQYVGREDFSSDAKEKFLKHIEELTSNTSQTAVRLSLQFKEGTGHTVALFPALRPSIYDSNMGMTQHKDKKDFLKAVKTIYSTNEVYEKVTKYTLEIFKK